MDSQITKAQEVYLNLVNGQSYTLCVAGATGAFKVQFQPQGTQYWMDYPDLGFTAEAGGFSNPANVRSAGFTAFTGRHRLVFADPQPNTYFYAVSTVTTPDN